MIFSGEYCKYCGAEVDKDVDSCPVCKHIFINNMAGKRKVADIETAVKKKEAIIKFLLAVTISGLFLSGAFIGAMAEAENNKDDLAWLILGIGSLVVIISLIGIIYSCQNISLVCKMQRQTTTRQKSDDGVLGTDTGDETEVDIDGKARTDTGAKTETSSNGRYGLFIYEYHDDGTYKWICGFCDGENTTNEERCPICGYLRTQC